MKANFNRVKQPAYIQIVFSDHTYTATVHDLKALENQCSLYVDMEREFRFGAIDQLGDVNVDGLVALMNRVRHYGTYNRNLQTEG